MRTFCIVCAVIAVAFAAASDISLKYDSDMGNLTSPSKNFAFRFCTPSIIDISFINTKAFGWTSASVNGSTAKPEKVAEGNGIVGVGVLPSHVSGPFALLAYANGTSAVNVNGEDLLKKLLSFDPVLDETFRGGVVAMAPLTLEEYNITTKESMINPISFVAPTHQTCKPVQLSGEKDYLQALACTYKPAEAYNSAEVTITYVSSKKAGIMEYGKTPVSARSLNMIIEVKGFKFTYENTSIRMRVGLFTSLGKSLIDNCTVRQGNATDSLYAAVSNFAVINGSRVEVNVSVHAGGLRNGEIEGLAPFVINYALGGAVTARIDSSVAVIDFPINVTDFVYDPALGVGTDVYRAGANTAVLSLLFALISVFAYLF